MKTWQLALVKPGASSSPRTRVASEYARRNGRKSMELANSGANTQPRTTGQSPVPSGRVHRRFESYKRPRQTKRKGPHALVKTSPNGSSGRTRTYDQAINSRPLYQLSYAGMAAIDSVTSATVKEPDLHRILAHRSLLRRARSRAACHASQHERGLLLSSTRRRFIRSDAMDPRAMEP